MTFYEKSKYYEALDELAKFIDQRIESAESDISYNAENMKNDREKWEEEGHEEPFENSWIYERNKSWEDAYKTNKLIWSKIKEQLNKM